MKPEGDGLRIARYVNVGVWFWLLVSDVLHRVVTTGDFWDEKLRQAFSLNRDILNAPAIAGQTIVILAFWFAVDLLLRWLWSQGRGSQQRED
jgi:hypothetical protein